MDRDGLVVEKYLAAECLHQRVMLLQRLFDVGPLMDDGGRSEV